MSALLCSSEHQLSGRPSDSQTRVHAIGLNRHWSPRLRSLSCSEATRAEPGQPVTGPAVWYSRDLQDRPDIWVYHLSDTAVEELDAAIHSIQASTVELKVSQAVCLEPVALCQYLFTKHCLLSACQTTTRTVPGV